MTESTAEGAAVVGLGDKERAFDAPVAHRNIVLATFQLFFWLVVHPSAWRAYVWSIDPELPPDFSILTLRVRHLRMPGIQRLLVQIYGIVPLLGCLMLLPVWYWLWRSRIMIETQVSMVSRSFLVTPTAITVSLGLGYAIAIVLGAGRSLVLAPLAGLAGHVVVGVFLLHPDIHVARSFVGHWGRAVIWPDIHTLVDSSAWGVAAAGFIAGGLGAVLQRLEPPLSGSATATRARSLGEIVAGVALGCLVSGGILIAAVAARNIVSGGRLRDYVLTGNVYALILTCCVALVTIAGWARGSSLLVSFVGSVAAAAVLCGLARAGLSELLRVYVRVAVDPSAVIIGLLYAGVIVAGSAVGRRVAGVVAGSIAGIVPGTLLLPALLLARMDLYEAMTPRDLLVLFGTATAAALVGATSPIWRPWLARPFVLMWNTILFARDQRRASGPLLLRLHSAFWDEDATWKLDGLTEHLIVAIDHDPTVGQAAMRSLAGTRHAWAVRDAQAELDVRLLAAATKLEQIETVHERLAVGEDDSSVRSEIRELVRVSRDLHAASRQVSAYNRRAALRAVDDRLEVFATRILRSGDARCARFLDIGNAWRDAVRAQIDRLDEEVDKLQELDSPYLPGVPLTEREEIFVGRVDVAARLEKMLHDGRSPPILLYGQRRMGKTSLLNNLGRLLPQGLLLLFVDLQFAALADHAAGLLHNIAEMMRRSAQERRALTLPALDAAALALDPYTGFEQWLGEVEKAFDGTILLALDEFEALDDGIRAGRFDERILALLRHVVQHRRHVRVVLSGAHTLDELAKWSTYLVNVQTIHLGYLEEQAARRLIERPTPGTLLKYEPEAVDAVVALTRCHPALIQLLCAEIVALKNTQPPARRRLATTDDLDEAVGAALEAGRLFFVDTEENRVTPDGAAVLRYVASLDQRHASRASIEERFPSMDLERVLRLLVQREIIEKGPGGELQFQVEMVRRWFAREAA